MGNDEGRSPTDIARKRRIDQVYWEGWEQGESWEPKNNPYNYDEDIELYQTWEAGFAGGKDWRKKL